MEDYEAGSVQFNYNVERPDLVSQVGLSAGNSIPDAHAKPVTPWLMPAGDVLSMISTAELVFDNKSPGRVTYTWARTYPARRW